VADADDPSRVAYIADAGPPKSKLSNTQYFLLAERATLTVVFRHTGDPHKVPVIPIDVGQSRYLVPRTVNLTGSATIELPAPAS
jgi:hypothetical protein